MDLNSYKDCREIPDAFMDSGTNPDGHEGGEAYIDCRLRLADGKVTGVCCGVAAKSTGDATGLAQVKLRLAGGNSKITHSLSVGLIHPVNVSRLYPSDANGVKLYYR